MADRPDAPVGRTGEAMPPPGASGRAERAPQRPSLVNPNTPPVIAKVPPPFVVRLSQFLWVLSFGVGGFAVVYFFVIRQTQLPLIADAVRAVSEGRDERTYETAADIVYWIVFGGLVVVLLVQITILVSFMGRRPNTRWWQLGSVTFQALLVVLSVELVAVGERGDPLRWMLYTQCGLAILALLAGVLPGGVAWTARRHDIRRREVSITQGGEF